MNVQNILDSLQGLNSQDFNVHILDDAWYSPKALIRALGSPIEEKYSAVACVRVSLPNGMLELHPRDDKVEVLCYCCFGGNPEKGLVPLADVKDLILSLRDHYCPPWPG